MVKSLVSKLSAASSNLSLASTLSSVAGGSSGGVGNVATETNYAKHRNDPGRFFGDGVQFKAKLIGILEVGEARGDRMCQEALQDLKMAIRAAGEHKQRITIHVTIDGLRLRDEKTGDSLYHHPVHKISFIAQDMTDSRAFGYIFGSPDSGHRFFGIKTDKAASQVVLAMRDLFQVVFELKKKEIELARQQIQSKSIHEHQLASLSSLKAAAATSGGGTSASGHNDLSGGVGGGSSISGGNTLSMLGSMGSGQGRLSAISRLGVNLDNKGAAKEMSPESVADLVDLEQELSSIQRGITQMERITPSEPTQPSMASAGSSGKATSEDDPFGDSFTNFPTYNLLPPPESGRSRHKPTKPTESGSSNSTAPVASQNATLSSLLSPAPAMSNSPAALQQDDDEGWLHELDQQSDVFDTSKAGVMGLGVGLSMAPLAPSESTSTPTQQLSDNSALVDVEAIVNGSTAIGGGTATAHATASSPVPLGEQAANTTKAVKSDAFTDLDPLGTGRTRPYVDKKYFFQELKNPPKKVLKDLSSAGIGGSAAANGGTAMDPTGQFNVVDEFLSKDSLFDDTLPATVGADSSTEAPMAHLHQQQPAAKQQPTLPPPLNIINTNQQSAEPTAGADPVMLPRDTDPFSPTRKKSDPFQEGGDVFAKLDPFEFEFAGAKNEIGQRASPSGTGPTSELQRPADVFNGPLQVNLPPERGVSPPAQWRADVSRLERPSSESPCGTNMQSISGTAPPAMSTVRSRPTPSGQLSGASLSMAGSNMSSVGHPPASSVFKQQTVDAISSKMPHLFGQTRFSKRDSNSINMRRLQESDSLSENETAPEPPPRPDSATHVEPPPLPPKKQFNDIVIRPRVTSGNAVPPPPTVSAINSLSCSNVGRYEFLNSVTKTTRAASDVPPIPLPSRRVGRSDGTYPGPGRPRKPGHTEDDYLAPIGVAGATSSHSANAGPDVPPLLPPPTQTSTRARTQRQQSLSKTHDIYENKSEIIQQQQQQHQHQQQQQQQQVEDSVAASAIIPDITLTQLLTLGIDELAAKLNVPMSKLSTMTLVELTSYLSEFIERSKPTSGVNAAKNASPVPTKRMEALSDRQQQHPQQKQAVFKVNFDQQATFVAKFDDTFGEDLPAARHTASASQDTFVANFAQFNEPPVAPPILDKASHSTPAVPPADRYAVFREIIDQELQHQQENADLLGDVIENDAEGGAATMEGVAVQSTPDELGAHFDAHFDDDDFLTGVTGAAAVHSQPPKIDTKITEVVAQAKDRYAALRDIILVENLFDKKIPTVAQMQPEFAEFGDDFNEDQDLKQIMDDRASSTGPDRLGLVDSRGFPAEASSSALTVEDDDEDEEGGAESSLDSNDKDADVTGGEQDKYEKLCTSTQQLDGEKFDKPETNGLSVDRVRSAGQPSASLLNAKQDNKFLTVANSSGLSSSKDDLEIDELMQRAISNLSLDSRERISPANSATNAADTNTATTMSTVVPRPNASLSATQSQFNDVSTSPIPLHKSPVPGAAQQQQKSPLSKSPQPSPVLTQLSAVSSLIDTATKQISTGGDVEPKNSKEFWATFDSPKPESVEKRSARATKTLKATTLHLPPPPPSNTSQNDTAESPCSSDPRDEGWSKSGGSGGGGGGGVSGSGGRRWTKKERHQTSSSSRDLSPWDDELPDYQKQKRIPAPPMPPGGQLPHGHAGDRHSYYMRHTRRMNSCDEDYDYEDEFSRRDHRKFKQGLSRSRDNFELESPSWYHHPTHHTWSPQDVEQAAALRARSFDRSAYERSTYGPPIYDKRGVALPPPGASSYDRRGTGYDKRKYYRDYARPNYDFEEYGESPPIQERYRETGSFEKLKMGRRSDYENIYDDSRSPMGAGGYKSRVDYMYDRDRKSFDRESVESFESATRRRRSFGSGDVYGSLESREDFRDRYMGGAEKTRSLRKGMKLRATGDIDYEQDSETEFHQRARSGAGGVGSESRSLQRPSQLSTVGMSTAQPRMRKSSGSSPWDGEEPPLPGQKSWKRPASAADSERRLAESRRAAALGQTPSGSDGEKDRRFRKKQRTRGKEQPYGSAVPPTSGGRYGNAPGLTHPARDNYDYITYDDDDVDDEEDYVDEEYDEPPTDEDKFERLNRRRHEMHQRMLESERRQQALGKLPISSLKCSAAAVSSTTAAAKKYHPCGGRGSEYDFDDYEQTPTPRSNASVGSTYPPTTTGSVGGGGVGSATSDNKFSFDGGFESDFNQSSPPPAPAGTASSCNSTPAAIGSVNATPATKSSFRFSNDFSDREKLQSFAQNSTSVSSLQQFDLDPMTSPASHTTPPITQKLRFDDNVKVSQFDDAAFEDDFSNAQFDFEKEDQWHAESLPASGSVALSAAKKQNLRNSKLQQRQELIKKSESVNIFAKKVEDPFEDDEFFKSPGEAKGNNGNNGNGNGSGNGHGHGNGASTAKVGAGGSNNFQCEDDFNFAKFDENM